MMKIFGMEFYWRRPMKEFKGLEGQLWTWTGVGFGNRFGIGVMSNRTHSL